MCGFLFFKKRKQKNRLTRSKTDIFGGYLNNQFLPVIFFKCSYFYILIGDHLKTFEKLNLANNLSTCEPTSNFWTSDWNFSMFMAISESLGSTLVGSPIWGFLMYTSFILVRASLVKEDVTSVFKAFSSNLRVTRCRPKKHARRFFCLLVCLFSGYLWSISFWMSLFSSSNLPCSFFLLCSGGRWLKSSGPEPWVTTQGGRGEQEINHERQWVNNKPD